MTKTEPVLGLNRFQGTRQASGEIGVLKCFFLYRTAEVGDGMPGKRRRSGSTPRRYRLFIGRAGSAARRALCYTANRIAVQETPLLDSKTVCCTANAVARQQKPFAAQQSPLLDSKTVCCTAIRAAVQQIDFPCSSGVFIVRERGLIHQGLRRPGW